MNPRILRLLMQLALVLVFAATIGLAALVTRHVRMSMRVELGPAHTQGRLTVRLPARWSSAPAAMDRGDAVEAEEPPGDQPGRRLRIWRQRCADLVSPLEHLYRIGRIKADALRSLAEGREGFSRQNLTVAGWPGQMISLQSLLRGGAVHKDIIACVVMGGSQAVVIQVEGFGPVDASDRELVRQMAENVSVTMQGAPDPGGGTAELPDNVQVGVPSRYLRVPTDDSNQLQRQLLFDGSWGGAWIGVDLASCIFFPDDTEDAFLAMLAARDPEWRSGPVKRLGARTLMVQRTDTTAAHFPARAYLLANADGRALLVVLRGGMGDGRLFDSLWQSLAGGVRFEKGGDPAGLLAHGAAAVKSLAGRAIEAGTGSQRWMIWDQAENTDQEVWSEYQWQTDDAGAITGTRRTLPVDSYADDAQHEQQWSATGDLSRYQVATYREVRRMGSPFARQTLEQRVTLEQGRIALSTGAGLGQSEVAAPPQYVPGAILPLVLCDLADKPCLLKTESFVGKQTVAGPGLLTLFVTRLSDAPLRRDEKGELMDCVSVSVNGTGQVSRWYFSQDRELRFIDFAGGLKAQQVKR